MAGIFHAAGTLDDGVLLQMNQERMLRVMKSKVAGAWNLHEASLALESPPDHFVLFSSAASLLGSRGQGNYAAANAWLDTLAHFRMQQGLPCISVNWGPWGEVGMAAQLDELATRRMLDMGWSPLATEDGMHLLHTLLGSELSQAGVLPLEFSRFIQQYPTKSVPAYYENVASLSGDREEGATPGSGTALVKQILESDTGERRGVVEDFLQKKVCALIGLSSDDKPDKTAQFPELGIDSLLHMELRSEITRDLNISLPVAQFLDNPSIEALSELVIRQLALSSVSGDGADGDEDMEEITL